MASERLNSTHVTLVASRRNGEDRHTGTSRSVPVHIYLPNLADGGAQNVMVRLANHFAALGHPTTLLYNVGGRYVARISPQVSQVKLPAGNMLSAALKLSSFLRRTAPPTLLTAMTFANLPALIAKRLSRVDTKIVISERHACSVWLANRRWSRRLLYGQMIPAIYPWADAVIAVSGGVASDLADLRVVPSDRIDVIYNPAIEPKARSDPGMIPDHPWFGPGQPPVIVAAGRLHPQKDFATLIRAFAQVRERRRIRLMILGEGEERPKLEALIARLALSDEVSLPGYIEDPLPYFSGAALFVLSSLYEGYPNVLVEALACGTPVISTDCQSGPREILEDGRYGRLVPVQDPLILGQAIDSQLDDSGDRAARFERAAEFRIEQIAESYLDVLRRVTSHQPRAVSVESESEGIPKAREF